jgi:plastocyanin
MFMRMALAAVLTVQIPALALAAEKHVVTMAASVYHPPTLTARVGDTLRFVNDDGTEHGVFVPTVGYATDLGTQKSKEARELILLKPGSFEVECTFHEHMLLKVEVTP